MAAVSAGPRNQFFRRKGDAEEASVFACLCRMWICVLQRVPVPRHCWDTTPDVSAFPKCPHSPIGISAALLFLRSHIPSYSVLLWQDVGLINKEKVLSGKSLQQHTQFVGEYKTRQTMFCVAQ